MSATITSLMLTSSFAVVGAVCSTGAGAGAACCGAGLLHPDRQRTPKPSMPSLIIVIVIDSPCGCRGHHRIANNTDTPFETSFLPASEAYTRWRAMAVQEGTFLFDHTTSAFCLP